MSDKLIATLYEKLVSRSMRITTAESCTGGLVASKITKKSGASKIFDYGFVTYSNKAKSDMLGIPINDINTHGAVSAETAAAMANGALKKSNADIAISITGIAGPDGGTKEKPVGTVYFGYAPKKGTTQTFKREFKGNRAEVQEKSAIAAIEHVITAID